MGIVAATMRRPHIAQEEQQHGDHQKAALDHIRSHRPERAGHEVGLVVVRRDFHALGERAIDLGHALANQAHDLPAVLAAAHHHDAAHHLALPVTRHGALSQLWAVRDGGDVADQHRCPCRPGANDGAGDVLRARGLAEAAQDVLLVAMLEMSAGGDGVAAFDGFNDVVEGETVGDEPLGLDGHLDLPDESAEGVDLGDAGYSSKLRPDDPIVDRAQFREISSAASTVYR